MSVTLRVLAVLGHLLAGAVLGMATLYLGYTLVTPQGAAWEHSAVQSFHTAFSGWWWEAAWDLTQLGYPPAIILVTLVLTLFWLLRRAWWKAGFFVANTLLMTVMVYTISNVFHRLRPELFPRPYVAGYAYPSGHSFFAVGYYGFIAFLLLYGLQGTWRTVGWIVWGLLALALGMTRLILGMHWPTDVIAGYLEGFWVWATAVMAVRYWKSTAANRALHVSQSK